ncbi:hypothetical protein L9F63_015767, partial [Diploptera punctata]
MVLCVSVYKCDVFPPKPMPTARAKVHLKEKIYIQNKNRIVNFENLGEQDLICKFINNSNYFIFIIFLIKSIRCLQRVHTRFTSQLTSNGLLSCSLQDRRPLDITLLKFILPTLRIKKCILPKCPWEYNRLDITLLNSNWRCGCQTGHISITFRRYIIN